MGRGLRGRVVSAYGGEDRWRAACAVEATVSVGGPLIRQKRGRDYPGLRAIADTRTPGIELGGFEESRLTAVLDGHAVRIESARGEIAERRADARAPFPDQDGREQRWDRLDMAYFLGYALWNYLTLPALLLRDDIDWRELSETSLEARFPAELPTHCAVQQYRFDPDTDLLEEYLYTAEVFGPWAAAVHTIVEHASHHGLAYPSKRRVLGRRDRSPVIEIDVQEHTVR